MDCKDCSNDLKEFDVINPCKVCELNNNDVSHKKCRFCHTCKAYICKDHWADAPERIEAAARNAIKAVVKKVGKLIKKNAAETTARTD